MLDIDGDEPLVLLEHLEHAFNRIDAPYVVVLDSVFCSEGTWIGLDLSLFALQDGLEGVVGVEEVRVVLFVVLVALPSALLQVLLFASIFVDTRDLCQHGLEELCFGFCYKGPDFQAREEHNISLPLLIVNNCPIASVLVVKAEHDHFWFSCQFVINCPLPVDLFDPVEPLHEEGVGIEPHSSVVIEDKQSVEICKCDDGKSGLAAYELQL